MTTRPAERGIGARLPSPELVAVLIAILLYGSLAVFGLPTGASSPGAVPDGTSIVGPTNSPDLATPSPDPRRGDVLAILEINERLIADREKLQEILAGSNLRASEIASVLRRISTQAKPAIDRASALSRDPAFRTVGAQLEIIYAESATAVDRALDTSITSDVPYREAAEGIIDLFVDLPGIGERLLSILATSSASPSPSQSSRPGASPSSGSGSSGAPPGGSPAPSMSPGMGSPRPDLTERLRDGGFEQGATQWEVTATPGVHVSVAAGGPLAGLGASSLQLEIAASDPAASMVVVKQGAINIRAGEGYKVQVVAVASTARSIRLRVVGTHQETHGIATVEVGPTATVASVRFTALIDDSSATLLIEMPGAYTGRVLFDDASLVEGPGAAASDP